MTTNFPDALDTTWQDPIGSDDLDTSPDGRTHAAHHADNQDALLAMERQLVGPVFDSAEAFTSVTVAGPLSGGGDCESTTGWTVVNAENPLTTTTAQFTQGTRSISVGRLRIGWQNNPALTSKAYVNLTADIPRGSALHVALDVRWNSTETTESDFNKVFEIVVADAVNLGGNVETTRLAFIEEAEWTTFRVPITDLTKVRSVGLRTFAHTDSANITTNITIDNIRFANQTPLEHALGAAAGAVVIPSDYDAGSQAFLPLDRDVVMVDLRPDHRRVRGEIDIREYQIPLDGVTDVSDLLQSVFLTLQPGDRLVFPSGYRFLLGKGIAIRDLHDVEIDLGGCKFYTQTSVVDGNLFSINDCTRLTFGNVRLYGYAPRTNTFSAGNSHAGTPVFPGDGTAQLVTKGDAVRLNTQNQGYTVDDEVPFDITIRQSSGSVQNDVSFEIISSDAPATALTAAAANLTEGGLQPGTYMYAVTFSDIDGRETSIGPRSFVTLAHGDAVNLTNIPTSSSGLQYRVRNIYRTIGPNMTDEARNLNLVRSILDNSTTTYFDNGKSTSASYEPNEAVTPLIGSAGSVDAGTHYYSFSVVTADGTESGMGQQKRLVTLSVPSKVNVTVPVSALASGAATKRKVYRTKAGAPQNTSDWFLVGSVTGNTLTVLEDNVPDAALSTRTVGARPGGQDFPNFAFAAMKATPGTTNGVIRYTWTPTEQRAHPYLIARKVSSETNTITLTQCAMTTYAQYDVAAEFSNGVSISGRSSEIEVHDVFATLMGGDAVTVSGAECRAIRVRRIYSYGNRRQGIAIANGHDITLEDIVIHHPGRSGIDIEPYSITAYTTNVNIRNVQIFNPKNLGIAAVNWGKIRGLYIDGLYITGVATGGGALTGSMRNITAWWGALGMSGQNMSMENCQGAGLRLLASTVTYTGTTDAATSGGHRVSNVRLLANDIINTSANNIISSVYLVSGPGAFVPTITLIAP